MGSDTYIQLADYRQRVFEIYARVRDPHMAPKANWQRFRREQDSLFKTHPQTALTPEQVMKFTSLRYYPYDPAYRFSLPIDPLKDQKAVRINLQDDGPTNLVPFGQMTFKLSGKSVCLTLYSMVPNLFEPPGPVASPVGRPGSASFPSLPHRPHPTGG